MKLIRPLLFATLLLASAAAAFATPPNLSEAKQQIREYYESGDWLREQAEVTESCRRYLEERLVSPPPRPAIVFDVDETAISAWAEEIAADFGYIPEHWTHWEQQADAPAIKPVLDLYRYARSRNLAVFFITGRKESARSWTEKNLRSAGYTDFEGIYLKPADYKDHSVVSLKSAARRDIQAKGYQILANVGDQQSDLDGGDAEASFKLPNPIYILP